MEPIRKNFHSRLFPFHINYHDKKQPDNELPTHSHDWYELVYVYSGKGRFFINNTFFDMEAGDLFALPGNTIHHAIPQKEKPVTSTALFFHPFLIQDYIINNSSFSYLQLFDNSTKLSNYRYSLKPDQQDETIKYISEIYHEKTMRKSGYKQAILLQLKMLLLFLNRSILHQQNKETIKSSVPKWLSEVLDYIEEHYTHKVSLKTLADCGNVSTAHLSRVFKQMTGLNVSEYIIKKKILLAKDLLLQTNENVATIAETCGFESLPYFYRTFKKYTGETPAHFRNLERYLN